MSKSSRGGRAAGWLRTCLCSLALLPAGGAGLAAQTDTVANQPAMTSPHGDAPRGSGYTPHRVYDVAARAFIDFETLAARAAAADVLFFGERHAHPPTHRMQHALLESLARRGGATLSLEMFERDVAAVVAAYVADEVDHAAFLAASRPWSRYFPDYHPLVEHARAHGWQVVAANVPRDVAGLVAQDGLDALDGLDDATRAHIAAEIDCPNDAYRARFIEEMARHPSTDGSDVDTGSAEVRRQRYYEAQCVKDETMAESIAAAAAGGAARPIVHVTGSFHSDRGDGIPARVRRRMPGLTMLSITSVPIADLDAADPAPHLERADFLLFTLAPQDPPAEPPG
jgi:uncharacterized iron-regulated protein